MSSSDSYSYEIDVKSVMYDKLAKYNKKMMECDAKKFMLCNIVNELSEKQELEKKYFKYLTESSKKISKYILQIEIISEKIRTLKTLMLDLEQLRLNKYVDNLNKKNIFKTILYGESDNESEVPFYEEEEEKKENNEDDKDYYDENDTYDEEKEYWNSTR